MSFARLAHTCVLPVVVLAVGCNPIPSDPDLGKSYTFKVKNETNSSALLSYTWSALNDDAPQTRQFDVIPHADASLGGSGSRGKYTLLSVSFYDIDWDNNFAKIPGPTSQLPEMPGRQLVWGDNFGGGSTILVTIYPDHIVVDVQSPAHADPLLSGPFTLPLSSPLPSGAPIKLYRNPSEPLLATARSEDGAFLEVLGTKNENGVPRRVSEIRYHGANEAASGPGTRLFLDSGARVSGIITEDGTEMWATWISETRAVVFARTADSVLLDHHVIDFSIDKASAGQQPRRATPARHTGKDNSMKFDRSQDAEYGGIIVEVTRCGEPFYNNEYDWIWPTGNYVYVGGYRLYAFERGGGSYLETESAYFVNEFLQTSALDAAACELAFEVLDAACAGTAGGLATAAGCLAFAAVPPPAGEILAAACEAANTVFTVFCLLFGNRGPIGTGACAAIEEILEAVTEQSEADVYAVATFRSGDDYLTAQSDPVKWTPGDSLPRLTIDYPGSGCVKTISAYYQVERVVGGPSPGEVLAKTEISYPSSWPPGTLDFASSHGIAHIYGERRNVAGRTTFVTTGSISAGTILAWPNEICFRQGVLLEVTHRPNERIFLTTRRSDPYQNEWNGFLYSVPTGYGTFIGGYFDQFLADGESVEIPADTTRVFLDIIRCVRDPSIPGARHAQDFTLEIDIEFRPPSLNPG